MTPFCRHANLDVTVEGPACFIRGSFFRNLVTWGQQRALHYQVTVVQMQDRQLQTFSEQRTKLEDTKGMLR